VADSGERTEAARMQSVYGFDCYEASNNEVEDLEETKEALLDTAYSLTPAEERDLEEEEVSVAHGPSAFECGLTAHHLCAQAARKPTKVPEGAYAGEVRFAVDRPVDTPLVSLAHSSMHACTLFTHRTAMRRWRPNRASFSRRKRRRSNGNGKWQAAPIENETSNWHKPTLVKRLPYERSHLPHTLRLYRFRPECVLKDGCGHT
jgi:hypothetical protein